MDRRYFLCSNISVFIQDEPLAENMEAGPGASLDVASLGLGAMAGVSNCELRPVKHPCNTIPSRIDTRRNHGVA